MKREIVNVVAAVAAVVLLAAGGPWLVHQLRTLPSAQRLSARSDQRIVTLEVVGMTCDACTQRIHQQLAGTPGVSACEVRREQSRAYVVCDAGLADSAVVNSVHRAGPGYYAAVVAK